MLAVYTYSNDIYSLAWGVVLSRVIGLSRTSKTDNSNSLTLSFLYKPFLLGLGKQICDIMKRISPNLIVCTLTREIVLKKGKVLYTRWGSGKVSQKAEKVIEANIALLKKGRYLIEIQELDGELISVVAQKYSNISNKKEIVLYSIYE